jgi:translation elongation factor EF-Tu-like GTPase
MFSRRFSAALAGFLLLSQAACADAPDAPAVADEVVFLGDDARVELLQSCGGDCRSGGTRFVTPPVGSGPSDVATLSAHAKHAVIVVEATTGPLPITREHIQIARQAGVPQISMMFVNLAGLEGDADAGELIELEELEMRELMNNYALDGDHAAVFHDRRIDSIAEPYAEAVGLDEVLRALAARPARQVFQVERSTGRNASTVVHLLTPAESNSTQAPTLGKGDAARIWVDSQVVDAVVTSSQAIAPGDTGDLAVEFRTDVTTSAGTRFLIERDGKVVAMGVVAEMRP